MDKNKLQHGNCNHMTLRKLEALIESYPKRKVYECGCLEADGECECVVFGESRESHDEYFVEPPSPNGKLTDRTTTSSHRTDYCN